IGVLHRNLTIEEQCDAVRTVKRFESGMIVNPITIEPDSTLGEARELMIRHRISGIPVAHGRGKLCGILTNRDVRFADDPLQPDRPPAAARGLMSRDRISGSPLADGSGKLGGILTNGDVRFAADPLQPVRELMTSENLATVREGVSQDEARRILHQRRIEKLL